MRYAEHPPCPELAPYIRCFWVLEGASPGSVPERILPDGCVEFIINFGEPFEQLHASGGAERQPRVFVVGPTTRALLVRPSPHVGVLGIRFLPGGARPFLHAPASEVADGIFELGPLSPIDAHVAERVHDVSDAYRRVRVAEEALIAVLRRARRAQDGVSAAVRMILATDGRVPVDHLASVQGISHRQLARRFRERVGVAPKLLCRLVRFQSVFTVIRDERPARLTDLAMRCGYFDQAHFVKEFREFTGVPPSAYLSDTHDLSDHFTGFGAE
jgi:AraC-like DNA-binding protein